MAVDEQVPLYPESGSLEDDLRRIAESSNNDTTTTPNYGSITAPHTHTHSAINDITTAVNSGDPDTDLLIQRLLREDAEEAQANGDTSDSGPTGPPPNIVQTFFDCIRNSNSEMISAFIDGGFVQPNTKSEGGVTPLVAAVRANQVRVVQQLVDYGADVNEMSAEVDYGQSVYYGNLYHHYFNDQYDILQRTPLMAAAEKGHLPLVKLFVEVFHAKDDIVPSDGMTALRLAAQNGHREVVDYLPSRRAGGMQRWKYKNRKALRRSKKLLFDIYQFNRVIFFEIPKFLVWTVPKHVLVLPIRDVVVHLWKNKKEIGEGIKIFFIETGKGIVRGAKAAVRGTAKGIKAAAAGTVKGIKAIPGVAVKAVKATGRGIAIASKAVWKFTTVDLPKGIVRFIKGLISFIKKAAIWTKDAIIAVAKALKRFTVWVAKQLWKTLTVRIPKALVAIAKFVANSVKYVGGKAAEFAIRLASAIHTLVTKVLNWFSGITWKDVLNGFIDVFKYIFVEIPKMLWAGTKRAGLFTKQILETLFGWIGTVFWYLGAGILFLFTYVPKKIFQLIGELFGAIGRGLHEVAVWINPKTI